jgi:hypothetical protein
VVRWRWWQVVAGGGTRTEQIVLIYLDLFSCFDFVSISFSFRSLFVFFFVFFFNFFFNFRRYTTVLVPLLVEWSLLWLAEKKVVGVKDSALRSYLLYRNHAKSPKSKHRDEAVLAMKGRRRG